MSLICVNCGSIVVLSNNPDHYGCCSSCPAGELNEPQRETIRESSRAFFKQAKLEVEEKKREEVRQYGQAKKSLR